MIPATFPFSSVFHVGLEECWLALVVFVVLFLLLIQIELSISGTGKGGLETSWLEGAREPTGGPAPTGNIVTGERGVHGSTIMMMNVLHSLQRSSRLLLHF
jgi:hypothetical protein